MVESDHGSMISLFRTRSSDERANGIKSTTYQNINQSQSQPATPPPTIHRNSSFSSRSNSLGALIGGENSLGKKIKKKLSISSASTNTTHPRSRSNSIRKSIDPTNPSYTSTTAGSTPNHNSPIFNNTSFSDITEDYFRYNNLKRRNKSNATSFSDSCFSHYSALRRSESHDPLDTVSVSAEETYSSHSFVSVEADSTLNSCRKILVEEMDNMNNFSDHHELDEDEEGELAESVAFDILQKIKEISINDSGDEYLDNTESF